MLNEKNGSPEAWMCGSSEPVSSAQRARETAKESIRMWYERTTKKWRMGLVWCTLFALVGAAVVYFIASFSFLARLQTFNGAMTIPIAGLIWLLAFVYIFLVPSREASFRSQEWIEAMVTIVERTVSEQVAPAAVVWGRVGAKIEKELPVLLEDIRGGFDTVKAAAVNLEKAVEKNEKLADEVRPVVESLKRIQSRVETEIQSGLFEEVRAAAVAVKSFGGGPIDKADLPRLPAGLTGLGGIFGKKKV